MRILADIDLLCFKVLVLGHYSMGNAFYGAVTVNSIGLELETYATSDAHKLQHSQAMDRSNGKQDP